MLSSVKLLSHARFECRARLTCHTHTTPPARLQRNYTLFRPTPNAIWCSMIHTNPWGILLYYAFLPLAGSLVGYFEHCERATSVWGVLACTPCLGATVFQLENVSSLSRDAHNTPLRPFSVGGKAPQSMQRRRFYFPNASILLGDLGDLVIGHPDQIHP